MNQPLAAFNRDHMVRGLRELIAALDTSGEEVQLRIVGGAAISLAYNAERAATVDIDAVLSPRDVILETAGRIAQRNNWVTDWLNDAARIFVPDGFGQRDAEWVCIAAVGKVQIYIASVETLLAMKLKSVIRRGLRELNDLRILLFLTGVNSVDEADALMEAFYPADALTDKAHNVVQRALDTLPTEHNAPEVPSLV